MVPLVDYADTAQIHVCFLKYGRGKKYKQQIKFEHSKDICVSVYSFWKQQLRQDNVFVEPTEYKLAL
jgi:hypothetical protein